LYQHAITVQGGAPDFRNGSLPDRRAPTVLVSAPRTHMPQPGRR
jgi:hypothetical protein